MINRDIITKIRDQEMDRKSFLKYSGLVLIGLTGFRAIVTLLNQTDQKATVADTTNQRRGFGSGKYGG